MKQQTSGLISRIIMIIAVLVFIGSAVQLIRIFSDYRTSNNEYETIAEEFTAETKPAAETPKQTASPDAKAADSGGTDDPEANVIEIVEPPITVDWEELKAINPDIIGWIYVEGQPTINYPVLRGDDNDEYLHRTLRRENRYAGAIFIDCQNSGRWDDPNTIVYGHNMRNGSMFGMLKFMNSQEAYDKNPYFWILTPERNDRYQIYSIFLTPTGSEVYTLFDQTGPEFLEWEKRMKSSSDIKSDVTLQETDHTVVLSTCTSDSSKRCVVLGKRIS